MSPFEQAGSSGTRRKCVQTDAYCHTSLLWSKRTKSVLMDNHFEVLQGITNSDYFKTGDKIGTEKNHIHNIGYKNIFRSCPFYYHNDK